MDHLPFFVVFQFIVRRVILINHAGEAEALVSDSLDVSQLIKLHLSKVEGHVILLDLPVERKAVRYLQEGFEVVWKLVWGIFFFPLCNCDLSNAFKSEK